MPERAPKSPHQRGDPPKHDKQTVFMAIIPESLRLNSGPRGAHSGDRGRPLREIASQRRSSAIGCLEGSRSRRRPRDLSMWDAEALRARAPARGGRGAAARRRRALRCGEAEAKAEADGAKPGRRPPASPPPPRRDPARPGSPPRPDPLPNPPAEAAAARLPGLGAHPGPRQERGRPAPPSRPSGSGRVAAAGGRAG
ncbi:translation initiation factor IF-2-like [Perognathus longimembris pacificus]|uniref:translation initiation factor IF-2-like n=1 Tax=Perognathus longimembris pacificus TaxID=214514 RepID=UPI002018D420|nr:translation initiation factor IF-2-like [Perognathus longimembris pacificus]